MKRRAQSSTLSLTEKKHEKMSSWRGSWNRFLSHWWLIRPVSSQPCAPNSAPPYQIFMYHYYLNYSISHLCNTVSTRDWRNLRPEATTRSLKTQYETGMKRLGKRKHICFYSNYRWLWANDLLQRLLKPHKSFFTPKCIFITGYKSQRSPKEEDALSYQTVKYSHAILKRHLQVN